MYRARLKGPTDAWASLHRALLCYLVIVHNLWLIYADQVVLLDTSKMSSLGWQTFPADRHSRRGWKEASYNMKDGDVYRVYYVCNVAHESVNNWLRLPYIEREKANRLYIQIHFTVRKCTKFHDPTRLQQCRESFKLLHFQTDSDFGDDRMPIWDTETYQHIDVIAADQTFLDSANVFINTETRSVAITKKGIYFAFYDQGTCATLISIKVYYITCPTVTKNFAIFRNTTTGVDVSDIVQVKGECVENAVMDTQPRYLCSSDGKWSYLEGGCTCQSGYQPFQGSQCRACLPGHHKWSSGSDMCQPCPAHSHALSHGAVECVCQEGYYRSVTDHKSMPCTQPPSEPHNVTVLFVDQTTITLAWDPPSYLGGRHDLEYRIQCEPCDGAVSFLPRQEHFNATMVSIEGLNPKTTYTISIFVENGVSVMVDRKVVHTVKVITIPSALTKVDQVKVLSVGLNYITLHWEWLSQAPENVDLYEVRWYPAFQQNRVRRTEAEHNNITFSNLDHNTEYIFQVRGKTKQGWGRYSFKVTVKTGTRLPSIKNIQSSKNPQHEQPVSIIAGSIVAVVMCMAIVIIMIVIFLKRNKQACNGKSLSEAEAMQYGMHDVPCSVSDYPPSANGTLTIPLFSPPGSIRAYVDPHTYEDPNQAVREFTKEIDSSLITIETVIGGGEFGDVCRGKLRMPGRGDLSVAIKTLKAGASDKNRLDFLTEASIMGQFDDPNVIYLEGVVTRSHPIMIVTEFMENGSLDTFLRNNDGKFTVIQLTGMMRGIASGMRYLAEMGYVHRDLAARNILVNANLVCKVADFGLSREMELDTSEGAYTTRGGKIPVRWTAPEAIAYRKFTSASDVWSYGVVMWEVMAYGERPYWNWSNQDVIKAIDKGYRLPPPMDCPEAVYQLLLDCWQKERGHRPKFSAIVKTLDKLIRAPELLRKVAKPRPYYNYVDPSLPYITEETSVHDWLISLKMERYVENFVSSGFTVMGQVAALNLKDLTNLGITLVGHQKKLLNSIQTIRLQLEDAQCTQSLLI